jgi:hypothetical protein
MTPQEFLSTWRHVELKERSASHSHFKDLCALLGVPDPVTADPKGEWFAFEKGASKTSGGEGWLDHAHRALDEAVADAYGWGDDYRSGLLADDEILARLFRLNQERAARES